MLDQLYEWLSNPLFALYFLILLPVSLCLAPKTNDVALNIQFDFKAFRLQQFDLQGKQFGSRSHAVNFEATAQQPTKGVSRRCLVLNWNQLVDREPSDLFAGMIGCVLIVLPPHKHIQHISTEHAKQLAEVEARLLRDKYDLPVYFAHENSELRSMLNGLQGSSHAQHSAAAALLDNVIANAYQLVAQAPSLLPKVDEPLYNILAMSPGADSNASGVAALLELLRVFSSYYANAKSRPNFDLLFVLSSAGTMNYQGSRQWIDQLYELADGTTPQVQSVLCLDALAQPGLNMHVSKAPSSDQSPISRLHQRFHSAALNRNNKSSGVPLVAKKINLADRHLAWEHEKYSIRRLAAFTLSHYGKDQHANVFRRTFLDTFERADMGALYENVQVISEALLRHVFNLPSASHHLPITPTSAVVREDHLTAWVRVLSKQSRSVQHLAGAGLKHPVVADLLQAMHAHATEAKAVPITLDKTDPEFGLYAVSEVAMAGYRVKPAIFDLVLASAIAAYLGLFYLAVSNVSVVLSFIETRLKQKKV